MKFSNVFKIGIKQFKKGGRGSKYYLDLWRYVAGLETAQASILR